MLQDIGMGLTGSHGKRKPVTDRARQGGLTGLPRLLGLGSTRPLGNSIKTDGAAHQG